MDLKRSKAEVEVSEVKPWVVIQRSRKAGLDVLAPVWWLNNHLKGGMALD